MSDPENQKQDLDPSCQTTSPSFVADPDDFDDANGVEDTDSALVKLTELAELLYLPRGVSQETINTRISRAIRLYEGLEPKDAAEAMLVQQMIGTHMAASECLKRAVKQRDSLEVQEQALKHAEKLMSLYTKQLAALNKHRGKGQQKVTVEHVHVEAGGQAIVGNVETGGSPASAPAGKEEDATPAEIGQSAEPTLDVSAPERTKVRRRRS